MEADSDFFDLSWSYLNPNYKSIASTDHGNKAGEEVSDHNGHLLTVPCAMLANECLMETSL